MIEKKRQPGNMKNIEKWKTDQNGKLEECESEKKEQWQIPKFPNLPTKYIIRKNQWLKKHRKH